MPKCTRIRRKHRKVCIGDLDNQINVVRRSLSKGMDSKEEAVFVPVLANAWAKIETLRGVFVVDQVNGGDQEATHRFTIVFPEGIEISGELWVQFDGKNYRILDQDDFEERHEFLDLMCTVRGDQTKDAANG